MKKDYYSIENLRFMVVFPLFLLGIAVFFEYSSLDMWWVAHFFDTKSHIWIFRNHWFYKTVMHSGGQMLDKFFGLIWLISFIVINAKENLRKNRRIFLFFLCASAAGPIIVGVCKSLTHIYTPWDLQIFSGIQPYVRFFDAAPAHAAVGHAFPAGHASGGYCFLSLYFVLLLFRSPYRFFGLVAGIFLGFAFGMSQQIRGAHFPSHDLVTLVICWYAAMALYLVFYPKEYKALKNNEIWKSQLLEE